MKMELSGRRFKKPESKREKKEFDLFSEPTRLLSAGSAAQTALTADKAAISLPIQDTVSNCHPLSDSALPFATQESKSYHASRRRADTMAVL